MPGVAAQFVKVFVPHLQTAQQRAEELFFRHAGQQRGQGAGELFFLAAQFFPVVAAIEGGQGRAQTGVAFRQAHADLSAFELRVAQGPQAFAQQGNAAVVEGHGRLPDSFRVGHMPPHQGGLEEGLAHFFHKCALLRANAGFSPLVVGEDGLAEKIGIAQQKDVVEGVHAVPVLRPVVHLAKKVDQRGFQSGGPAGFH